MKRLECVLVLLGSLSSAACSWWRFDDVTETAPVVVLKKPESMTTGFGVSLASGLEGTEGRLLVGGSEGASRAALYDLSNVDDPNVAPIADHFCSNSKGRCFLGHTIAFLPITSVPPDREDTGPIESCVAEGIGHAPIEEAGLLFECQNKAIFSRKVPDVGYYRDDIDLALSPAADQPEVVSVASDGTDDPAIVVGAPSQPVAWFYAPSSEEPIELHAPGEVRETFGQEVTAWVVGDTRMFAVAEPGESALHLFRASGGAVDYVGCLGGPPGFGRKLATGRVLADDVADLVVSDQTNVHVFDGEKLAELPAATGISCTLAALPEDTLIASFGCGSTEDVSECGVSSFGNALAVGDLDGDGDGEVVVGASGMTVRGVSGAGAVLVWDVDAVSDTTLTEAKFLADSESGAGLGGAVATVRAGDRDIVAAGLSRSGKVALFYCSKLLSGGQRSGRCE